LRQLACDPGQGSGDVAPIPTGGHTSGLWTARQVAAHYGVTRNFVYQHAEELGCIRLGGGECPRLRFDPAVVRERWQRVREPSSARSPRGRSAPRRRAVGRPRQPDYKLLDFDRDP
jgi:hypothetical protein